MWIIVIHLYIVSISCKKKKRKMYKQFPETRKALNRADLSKGSSALALSLKQKQKLTSFSCQLIIRLLINNNNNKKN